MKIPFIIEHFTWLDRGAGNPYTVTRVTRTVNGDTVDVATGYGRGENAAREVYRRCSSGVETAYEIKTKVTSADYKMLERKAAHGDYWMDGLITGLYPVNR